MLHEVLDNGSDRMAMRGEYSKGNPKLTYQGAIFPAHLIIIG
jgi:hypothetical protein